MSEDFAFDEIAEDIRTQDGAMTSHPYFVVFDGNPYWLFVHAFFTRAAAERYIEGRSHNLRRPFIWVASAHDNYEVRAARAAFAEIARLRAKVDEWRSRYEAACLDRDVAEAKVAGDWPNALVEAQRDRAESAEARVAELEAAAWELFQAFDGTDVALQARMLDNLRALLAPREPKSCGKCGGSGYVRDTGPDGEPAGDYCPECRGGEDGR